jgi:glucose dehydrogenase
MSAVPFGRVAFDLLPLVALALLASAASLWWSLQSRGVILAWVGATISTLLVAVGAAGSVPRGAAPLVVAALAAVAVASCVARADTTLRYLSEQDR